MSCKSCNSPDNDLDNSDSYEATLLGLTEAVNGNSEKIAEVRQMLEAIIKHLDVPYKPPAGVIKD